MLPIFSQFKSLVSPIAEPVQKAGKWVWNQSNEDTRVGLKSVVCALSSTTCTVISAHLLDYGAVPAIQVATALGVCVIASSIFTHPSLNSIALTLSGTLLVLSPEGLVHVAGLIGGSFLGALAMSKFLGIELRTLEPTFEPQLEPAPEPMHHLLPVDEPFFSSLHTANEGA